MTDWPPKQTYLQREVDLKACFCIGPKNGEPYCPCKMRAMEEEKRMNFEKFVMDTFGSWEEYQRYINARNNVRPD